MTQTSCAPLLGKLSVDLKALKECQRIGGHVPVPKIDADTDYRELAPHALASVNQANRGSDARTRCENHVIEAYEQAQ